MDDESLATDRVRVSATGIHLRWNATACVMATALLMMTLLAACAGSGADDASPPGATAIGGSGGSASPTPTIAPAVKSAIDGQYLMRLSRQDASSAGLRPGTASSIAGTWRLTLSFGYAQQFVNVGGGGITVDGYIGGFSVTGHRLVLTDGSRLVFDWRLREGMLTLTPAEGSPKDLVDRVIWATHPWKRVGS